MYFLQKQHKACSVNPNNNVLIKTCCYAAMKLLLGNGSKKEGTVRSRTSNRQRKEFTVRHSFTRLELLQSYCKMLQGKARALPEQRKTGRHMLHWPMDTAHMMERASEGHMTSLRRRPWLRWTSDKSRRLA